MKRSHLDEFVEVYKPGKRDARIESERFKSYTYEALLVRDKVNLDLIWLKDDSLEDAANLPSPEIIAREIMENLESALTEFSSIVGALEAGQINDSL
jgi:type I restriction enzyme M protein